MSKDFFSKEAISQIPKILTLQDRNPHSPTYGFFDRNFWHYKIIDFPSGMAQEFVWPLALAYETNVINNPFYKKPAIKEWVEAGILFAYRNAHPDGSYGGEYGSRNTYTFFPHGFELIGRWMPEALSINDHFLIGLYKGLSPCYCDDHIIGHQTWNYLLAFRD